MAKKQAEKKDFSIQTSFLKPPVVAVVGHIDHGKTSLLDRIRATQVAVREAGGITQKIGASTIEFKTKEGIFRKITFIDTPGHAAFTKMRSRGVEVTDLAVLVVAADSGVQEQTKESFDHIKAAKTPFLVAINKIDLPTADINRVKSQLIDIGIAPEDYGGETVVIPVSAKTGEGIPELLEMICLVADLQGKKVDPSGELEGVVIESTFDVKCGPLATVLVKNGRIKIGDEVYAETVKAKVKSLKDWQGNLVKEILPGEAAEIFGFESVPQVGALVTNTLLDLGKKITQEVSVDKSEEDKKIKIIIKADLEGSLEAILGGLPKEVKVIHAGTGALSDSDVFLAQTVGAKIFIFNSRILPSAENLIAQSGIFCFSTKIIYELFEQLEKIIKEGEKKKVEINGEFLGKAEVIAEFKIKDKRIAGCRVKEGKVVLNSKACLVRGEEKIGEANIVSMRHLQEEIVEASVPEEFGVLFSPSLDFQIGDVIISYNPNKKDF